MYLDQLPIFERLLKEDKEQGTNNAGELIVHVFKYIKGENPVPVNFIVDIAFQSIKVKLKKDLIKWEERKEKAKESANKRWDNEKRPKKEVKKVENDDFRNLDFDIFWSKYPNKVAKPKCKDKFLKLSDKDIETIFSTIDLFIEYKPFDEYKHPNPYTYLNQQRWLDEIPPKSEWTKQKQQQNGNTKASRLSKFTNA